MAVTGPTDKDNIHVSQCQKFLRLLDVDTDQIIQLEALDTGKVTADGIAIFALATVPGTPGTGSTVKPHQGARVVAAAGTQVSLNSFPICTLSVPAHSAGIFGDYTAHIAVGDTITIEGSTGNDGAHVVESFSYAAGITTVVFVAGTIVDATVDGNFEFGTMPVQSVVIQAKSTNTGAIYIGDKDIAAGLGITINAGEFAIIEANGYPFDLIDVYIDAAVNGEGVTWLLLG